MDRFGLICCLLEYQFTDDNDHDVLSSENQTSTISDTSTDDVLLSENEEI